MNCQCTQWLHSQLSTATEPYKVVVCHEPPYSSGVTHGSYSAMQWPFKSWGASVVISGHDHDYERLSIDGLPYLVVGTGGDSLRGWGTIVSGSQFRYNGDFGALLVTADSASMIMSFYSEAGILIDSYTLQAISSTSNVATSPSANSSGFNSGDAVRSGS